MTEPSACEHEFTGLKMQTQMICERCGKPEVSILAELNAALQARVEELEKAVSKCAEAGTLKQVIAARRAARAALAGKGKG